MTAIDAAPGRRTSSAHRLARTVLDVLGTVAAAGSALVSGGLLLSLASAWWWLHASTFCREVDCITAIPADFIDGPVAMAASEAVAANPIGMWSVLTYGIVFAAGAGCAVVLLLAGLVLSGPVRSVRGLRARSTAGRVRLTAVLLLALLALASAASVEVLQVMTYLLE